MSSKAFVDLVQMSFEMKEKESSINLATEVTLSYALKFWHAMTSSIESLSQ